MSTPTVVSTPYDWRIGARKFALAAGKTLLGIVVGAIVQQLANPASPLYTQLTQAYPTLVAVPPLVAGVVAWGYNLWKQKR